MLLVSSNRFDAKYILNPLICLPAVKKIFSLLSCLNIYIGEWIFVMSDDLPRSDRYLKILLHF